VRSAARPSDDTTHLTTEVVRELYTSHPYPDPRYVAEVQVTVTGLLDWITSLYWPFRPSLSGLRVLDAGCGTGMGSMSVAKRHPEVEVIGIDLSDASLELARAAAKQRGLKNVTFHRASLLDAADFGSFQYIISSGVIHHMADPVAGFRALRETLTPDGVLMAMVYALHGRAGVYLLQEAFRRLAPEGYRTVAPGTARAIAGNLTHGHPFNVERFGEMAWEDDCGIVDLLLHPQDRAYTVPQLIDHLSQAGLTLSRFVDQQTYEPTRYPLPEPERARAAAMPAGDRWALAELLHGNMIKHEFIAHRDSFTPFTIEAEGAILLATRIKRCPIWNWGAVSQQRDDRGNVTFKIEDWITSAGQRSLSLQRWQVELLQAFNGDATAMDIFDRPAVQKLIPGTSRDEKLSLYGQLLEALVEQEVLLVDPS
jgi:2-polyprenyl-3-methyl-5-hydroxy-6-metoxy-1,4-benzoquinol methylase